MDDVREADDQHHRWDQRQHHAHVRVQRDRERRGPHHRQQRHAGCHQHRQQRTKQQEHHEHQHHRYDRQPQAEAALTLLDDLEDDRRQAGFVQGSRGDTGFLQDRLDRDDQLGAALRRSVCARCQLDDERDVTAVTADERARGAVVGEDGAHHVGGVFGFVLGRTSVPANLQHARPGAHFLRGVQAVDPGDIIELQNAVGGLLHRREALGVQRLGAREAEDHHLVAAEVFSELQKPCKSRVVAHEHLGERGRDHGALHRKNRAAGRDSEHEAKDLDATAQDETDPGVHRGAVRGRWVSDVGVAQACADCHDRSMGRQSYHHVCRTDGRRL